MVNLHSTIKTEGKGLRPRWQSKKTLNSPLTSTPKSQLSAEQQTKVQDQMASQVNSIKHLEKS